MKNYPQAPRSRTTTAYFGVRVADPYRPLEDLDAPETRRWVKAQAAYARRYFRAIPQRDAIARRLAKIVNYERMSVPWHVKDRYFFLRNSGLQDQAVLYTMTGANGKPRVLVDPNAFSADGTIALAECEVSPNAKLLAYSTCSSGSDWQTWRVRDVATGKDLPDELRWSKFSTAAWLPDASGFLYERYPEPQRGVTYKAANEHHAVWLHRLGTPQSADVRVAYDPAHPDWRYSARTTFDGRYAIVSVFNPQSIHHRVAYLDLGDPTFAVHRLFWKNDAEYAFVAGRGSTLYFSTTLDAPNGRVIAVDVTAPRAVRTVIRQQKYALQHVAAAGDQLLPIYLKHAHAMVRSYDYDGRLMRDVELPGNGMVAGFDGTPDDATAFYAYSSRTTPPSIYSYDLVRGTSALYRKAKIAFDAQRFESKQVFYRSGDGTRVPMTISYRKGTKLDGKNPTILYGYGGFNVPIVPEFSPFVATWLQMGGVYAVANIRGGSEYGDAWHRAGMRSRKQRVFDDFIAAAEYLIARKYTSREKLAVRGASNGGLLVGAMLTQRPDLFAAALPGVGVMDMLRFEQFTIGKAWIAEYGCATHGKRQFETLYAYSPYHNVRRGTRYPATLITTADHDDRVFPAHSYKFAAAMQAAQAGTAPILLRVESKAGHGAGVSTSKAIAEYADVYAFVVKNLDVTLPPAF